VSIAAAAALVLSMAACSSGSSSGAPKSLVVYSADPANAKTYQKIMNKFGDENNVKIQIISYPSANFIQQFSSAVNGKSQIDVLLANGQDVRYLQSKELLGDLGSSVSTKDLIPAGYEPFTINNKLYAVGIGGVNVTAFIYNQAIFDKYGLTVPKTTDDLIADAKKLDGTGIAPVSVPGGNVYLWPIWMMQMLQQTTKNTPTQTTFDTLQKGSPTFDSAKYVQALDEMQKLGAGNIFANGWQGLQEDAAVSLFSQSKAAMFFGGSWDISTIAGQAPNMNIKAFDFPNFVPGVTSTGFGGAGVAAGVYGKINSNDKTLATKLVSYMSSAAVNKQLITGTAAISLPVNKSVKPPTSSPLQDQLVNDFLPKESTFLDWYWPKQVTAAYQQGMVSVVNGSKSAADVSKDVQSAFETAKSGGWKFN
jgi:ABC-type glycerol-3-phosphate transport system substrate-binding protein